MQDHIGSQWREHRAEAARKEADRLDTELRKQRQNRDCPTCGNHHRHIGWRVCVVKRMQEARSQEQEA